MLGLAQTGILHTTAAWHGSFWKQERGLKWAHGFRMGNGICIYPEQIDVRWTSLFRAPYSWAPLCCCSTQLTKGGGGHATAFSGFSCFRSQFHIFGFALSPNDGTNARKLIEAGIETFYDVHDKTTLEICNLIQTHQIHIMVDLNGCVLLGAPACPRAQPAPGPVLQGVLLRSKSASTIFGIDSAVLQTSTGRVGQVGGVCVKFDEIDENEGRPTNY